MPDRDRVDELVDRGAEYVRLGYMQLDELSVPDRDDRDDLDLTDEELRARVRDRLQELDECDDQDDQEEPTDPTGPTKVDWPALWDEFGFGHADEIDSDLISKTQLKTAIEVSDQGIGRQPEAVIHEAVEGGDLEIVRAVGDGQPVVRGYRLAGDDLDQ